MATTAEIQALEQAAEELKKKLNDQKKAILKKKKDFEREQAEIIGRAFIKSAECGGSYRTHISATDLPKVADILSAFAARNGKQESEQNPPPVPPVRQNGFGSSY